MLHGQKRVPKTDAEVAALIAKASEICALQPQLLHNHHNNITWYHRKWILSKGFLSSYDNELRLICSRTQEYSRKRRAKFHKRDAM
ncbi:hypothetical protein AQUCO_00400385v1 [Aquilegia coerulea]|uniref:Uncharacterized protein n=1 Tax=Aquilegia coerulea TaxID=218851 RepID=A0A2G5EUN5_AQUCA|nr:hypothetical protein AQUCO_00400385v1 [Aquilegia coerulea]